MFEFVQVEADFRYVVYFGKNIPVHKMYTHIATDKDGRIYAYTTEPRVSECSPTIWSMPKEGAGYDDKEKVTFLGEERFDGYWTQSMVLISDLRRY